VLLQAALAIAVAGPATSPEYLPLRVADAEGYFADEQLAVTLETTRAEAIAAQALGHARVTIAATSLDAAITLGHAGGVPPRLIFGLTAAAPVVLLVPAPQKDKIRALADLAGKTIGITAPGTPGQVALYSILARAEISARQISLQSFGERGLVAAVESEAVAAAVVEDPWATRLLQEGKAVALADLRKRDDAARWLGGATVHAALFVRGDTKLGTAELTPLARALLRAQGRIQNTSPEDLVVKLPRPVVGAPEDFALRLLGARDGYLPDGWVSADTFKRSVALFRSHSAIPAKVDLPWRLGKLLFTEPLEAALGRRP